VRHQFNAAWMGRELRVSLTNANTGERGLSGAGKRVGMCGDARRGCSKSERAQENRADKGKHREYRQHVEIQGKVHVASSASF
jgi:hypothetical protein